jgi:hypothetical protein
MGLHLTALVPGHNGTMLIGGGNAVNKEQFSKLWKKFSGDAKLHWEDGTPFCP